MVLLRAFLLLFCVECFVVPLAEGSCSSLGSYEELLLCTVQQQQQEINNLKAAVFSLTTELNNLTRHQQQIPARCSSNVVFRAQLTHNMYSATDKVIYDYVIENVGGAYDVKTGVFHAPCNGTYLFTLLAAAQDGHNTNIYIIKDHKKIAYTFGIGSGHWDHASAFATVSMKAGESAWVTLDDFVAGSNPDYYHAYSVFSGALIRDE